MTNQQGAPEALMLAGAVDHWARADYGLRGDEMRKAAAELRRLHYENQRLAAMVEAQQPATHVQKPAEIEHVVGDVSKNGPGSNMAQQPAPSAAAALSDDLRDRLVAISEAIADQDDRAAQAMLREILAAPQPSPTPQADSQPAPDLDMAVMQLAEIVGLIGPASRTHDLHAAVQRFHDLICANATINAAVMAADVIMGAATSARDYPPLPRVGAIGYASVVDIDSYAKTLTIGPHLPGVRDIALWTTDQMRAYVDADRAARAPADSVTAPAGGGVTGPEWKWVPMDATDDMVRATDKVNFENEDTDGTIHNVWNTMLAAAPTPPAPAADSVLEDAARYRWLRQHWFTMLSNYQRGITFKVGEPRWSDITEEELDAAIDAARKQGGA